MPIYEFKCKECAHEFERLVFRSDEEVQCPGCSGKNVTRLMSACAFKSDSGFTPASGSSGCSSCSASSCAGCH
jgi:putative FmdB family regulatory protein